MRVKLFAFLFVFNRHCRGILVNADIMHAFEVAGEPVFLLRHIETEMVAGFDVIEVSVRIGLLGREIIDKALPFLAGKHFK